MSNSIRNLATAAAVIIAVGQLTDAGPIDPDDTGLSGTMELWLAADDIDGDGQTNDNPSDGTTIGTATNPWECKSTIYSAVRYTSTYGYPTYRTSIKNGKPVVRFNHTNSDGDGDSLFINDFTMNELSNLRLTAFVVMDGTQGIAHHHVGAVPRLYLQHNRFTYGDSNSNAVDYANPSGFNIHTYQHNGSQIEAWLNGLSKGTFNVDLSEFTSTDMDLFLPLKPGMTSGDIAEVIIYTHADANDLFTDGQRFGIEQWLGEKYGLAVVPEPATWGLLVVGWLGLLVARRRRKR